MDNKEFEKMKNEFNNLEQKNNDLEQKNKILEFKLKTKQLELNKIYNSKSWKITLPLRRIKQKINKNDKVSIIIPVYNSENWIDILIESIINQSYKNIEILIVDDGSTDSTYDICNKYVQIDNRIKLYKQKNQGPGSARNLAFNHSTGEYIMYADSDDYFEYNAIEIALREIKSRKLDIMNFNALCFYDNIDESESGIANDRYLKKNDYDEIMSGLDYFKTLRKNVDFSSVVWSFIYRKSLIAENNIKFAATPCHDDMLFSFECLFYAQKAGFIKDILYNRRVRKSSITTSHKNIKNIFSYYIVINQLKDNYSKYEDGDINHFISDIENSMNLALRNVKINELNKEKNNYNKQFINFVKDKIKNKDNNLQ